MGDGSIVGCVDEVKAMKGSEKDDRIYLFRHMYLP